MRHVFGAACALYLACAAIALAQNPTITISKIHVIVSDGPVSQRDQGRDLVAAHAKAQAEGRMLRPDVVATADAIRKQINLADGLVFDGPPLAFFELVDREKRSLWRTERFRDVAVWWDENDAETDLYFLVQLSEQYLLADRVDVHWGRYDVAAGAFAVNPRNGQLKSGKAKMSRSSIRSLTGFRPGDYVSDEDLAIAEQKIRYEYASKGYPNAIVRSVLLTPREGDDEGGYLLQFRIDIREKVKAGRFAFEGNSALDDGELRALVKRFAWYNPFSWWRKVKDEPGELAAVKDRLYAAYHAQGYLDVEIGELRLNQGTDGRPVLEVEILHEGPAYRVGVIDVRGVTLFPESQVRSVLSLGAGDVAARQRIQRNGANLVRFFGRRGYINANADPRLLTDAGSGIVNIIYDVREGEQVEIRDVWIVGNTRTKDEVMRRELTVYPGDTYNMDAVEKSERRLMNLGFFGSARAVPKRVPGTSEGVRDLEFQVSEKRTGSLTFGAGFSSVDNVIGFLEMSQGNFDVTRWPPHGDGQKLNLRAQFGDNRREYGISFTEPWFLDRRLSFGVDLYDRERNFEGYSVKRRGGALRLGKSLGKGKRLDFQYTLESSKLVDSSNTNEWTTASGDPFFFSTRQDAVESAVQARWTYDGRNQFFTPSAGEKVTAKANLSGGILGFDTELYGLELQAEKYVPLWAGHVLAIKGRGQVVEEYGDTDELFLFDKLFAGGGRTIRGFDYREVGPKVTLQNSSGDILDHRPIGGRTLALLTAEYVVPLVDGIRVAGFVDAGGVWEDAYDIDTDRYASGAGVELRFDIPSFPIRIYYAKPLREDDDLTELQEWGFWIGF